MRETSVGRFVDDKRLVEESTREGLSERREFYLLKVSGKVRVEFHSGRNLSKTGRR